jgi:hypothetical protein
LRGKLRIEVEELRTERRGKLRGEVEDLGEMLRIQRRSQGLMIGIEGRIQTFR